MLMSCLRRSAAARAAANAPAGTAAAAVAAAAASSPLGAGGTLCGDADDDGGGGGGGIIIARSSSSLSLASSASASTPWLSTMQRLSRGSGSGGSGGGGACASAPSSLAGGSSPSSLAGGSSPSSLAGGSSPTSTSSISGGSDDESEVAATASAAAAATMLAVAAASHGAGAGHKKAASVSGGSPPPRPAAAAAATAPMSLLRSWSWSGLAEHGTPARALLLEQRVAAAAGAAGAALHPAAAAHLHGTLAFAFSGGGFRFTWLLGAMSVFHELNLVTEHTRVSGASCGALVAVLLKAGLDAGQVLSLTRQFAAELRQPNTNASGGGGGGYLLRNFGAAIRGRLGPALRRALEEHLPADVHLKCSHTHLAITQVWPRLRTSLFSEFRSREELIRHVMASCHLPKISDGSLTVGGLSRGGLHIDGGLLSVVTPPPPPPPPLSPSPLLGLGVMPAAAASPDGEALVGPLANHHQQKHQQQHHSHSHSHNHSHNHSHHYTVLVCSMPSRFIRLLPPGIGRPKPQDISISPDTFSQSWPWSRTETTQLAVTPPTDAAIDDFVERGCRDAWAWAEAVGLARDGRAVFPAAGELEAMRRMA